MIGSMFRKAWYSDSATLNLDFTTGVLDSRLTFTRAANTATVINSSGLVQTVNADVPRFDYDPDTLAPRGLLIEGAATNLALQSDTLPTPTNWVANAITRTNVSAVTPDGNTTATTCGLSHTGSGSFRSQAITVTASTKYTFSFWAKNNGGSVALYRAYNVSGSADIVAETSYFSQINGSTWTRVQFTFTTPVGCTSVYVYPLSQSSGTSNVLVWGAQMEQGSGASSYIPTGASQVTRNADECSMTGSNFSSWFTNSAEGSFYVAYNMNYPDAFLGTTVPRRAIDLSDAGGTNRLYGNAAYQVTPPANAGRLVRVFDSGTVDLNSAGTLVATAAQNTRWAMGYKTNDNHLAWVGGSASDNSGTLATGFTTMFIGAQRNFTGAFLNGTIRTIKYWPTRLPDATLQSLTT